MIRSTDDLRELSESDVEALDSVWKEYGYYSATKLCDITHSSFCLNGKILKAIANRYL